MALRIVLFGNLTIDHNITETGRWIGPGGSVYFGAKIAENLGMLPTIVSPYGKDFPRHLLPQTVFYPTNPTIEKTLIFENIHQGEGTRTQKVREYHNQKRISGRHAFSSLPPHPDCIVIAPILSNITSEEIEDISRHFARSLKVFLPQGLYRLVGERGIVEKRDWQPTRECISLFDIIVTSEKDSIQMEEKVRQWSESGPIGIVTKGEKGCSLFLKGERTDIPAFSIPHVVDSTGAGDIFAVGLSFAYLKTHTIHTSVVFAHGAAGYSLRFTSNQLQYRKSDIISLADQQGRKIEI